MKRYKRLEENSKIINCKIGQRIYEVDLDFNIQEYKNIFGTKLTNIEKVFGKQLKVKGGVDKADYMFKGKIDITIEGLLATAYQLTGDKIFKDLNELILTIFGKTEGALDYWVEVPEDVNFTEITIDVDFTFLYNQTLDLTIDIY